MYLERFRMFLFILHHSDLGARALAARIKGKTPDEICTLFNLPKGRFPLDDLVRLICAPHDAPH